MNFVRCLIVTAALTATAGTAFAQSAECVRLQQAISSVPSADPTEVQKFASAAQHQRSELDRTISYSRSIGCGRRQFLFFGDAPPAQCPALEQQISRMQANYEQLAAQVQQLSGDAQRRALTARYEANCRPGAGERTVSRGFLDQLFGGSDPRSGLRDVPMNPDPGAPAGDTLPPPEDATKGGTKAVCVRTCDGGFFPVSYAANRGNTGNLEELCHALCPNAETQLFTYSPSRDIDSAVSVSGQSYMSLPNALKYRTKFDPACTCKPPNQGWAQALGNAEQLLGDRGRDTIVTPERAEELSRARQPGQASRSKAPPAAKPGMAPAASVAKPGTAPAAAAAGLPATPAPSAARPGDDQTRDVVGPDGVTRKIRTVGPTP